MTRKALLSEIDSAWALLAADLLCQNRKLSLRDAERGARRLVEQWAFEALGNDRQRGRVPCFPVGDDFRLPSPPDSSVAARASIDRAVRCGSPPVDLLEAIHQHLLSRRLHRAPGGRLAAESSPLPRRAQGIYYTPDYIARYLAARCLAGAAEHAIPRILDPACGCGRFLVAAAEQALEPGGPRSALAIARQLHGVDLDGEAVAVARRALWLVLRPHLPDDDESRQLASILGRNVVCGNSLTDALWPNGQPFAIVLGNPPYRRELGAKKLLDAIAESDFGRRYRAPRMDLWYYFLHRGLELLAPEGRLGFIVGAYWAAGTGADRLIGTLRQTVRVEEIFQLDRLQVFPGLGGRHMLLVLSKSPPGGRTTIRLPVCDAPTDARPFVEGRFPVRTFQKSHPQLFRAGLLDLEPPADRLLARLGRHPALADLGTIRQGIAENPASVTRAANRRHGDRWRTGEGVFALTAQEVEQLELPAVEAALLRPYHDLCDLGRYDRADRPSLRLIYSTRETWPRPECAPALARHLDRFRAILDARRETRSGVRPWWQLHWPREERLWESPKLVGLQMQPRPSFVPAVEATYVSFSANVFLPDPAVREPLGYFAAVLNSRLLWKWFRHHAKRRGVGLEINGHVLARAPIRRIDFDSPEDAAACDRLDALVVRMLDLARLRRTRPQPAILESIEAEWAVNDAEIDRLVCRLYGVAEEEIATSGMAGPPAANPNQVAFRSASD